MKKKAKQMQMKSVPGIEFGVNSKNMKAGEEIFAQLFGAEQQFHFGFGLAQSRVPFLLSEDIESKKQDGEISSNPLFFLIICYFHSTRYFESKCHYIEQNISSKLFDT